MAFHPAIELKINKRTTRVYVSVENSVFKHSERQRIIGYLKKVFDLNKSVLNHGTKQVMLLWSEEYVPMIDWWIWGEKESESAGAAIEVYLFRDTKQYDSPLVTAEDGLKILASEAK